MEKSVQLTLEFTEEQYEILKQISERKKMTVEKYVVKMLSETIEKDLENLT